MEAQAPLMADRRPRHMIARRMKCGTLRYYWQPSKAAKLAGFQPRTLGTDLAQAVRLAEQINGDWDRWRRGEEGINPALAPGSLPWLCARFEASSRWPKGESSRKVYRWAIAKLTDWSAEWDHAPIADIEPEDLEALSSDLLEIWAPHSVGVITTVLRMVLKFGLARRHIDHNPAYDVRFTTPEPRNVVWSEAEVETFVSGAERRLAHAALCIYESAQRPSDAVAMTKAKIKPGGLILVRQQKTNALIDVPMTQRMRDAVDSEARDSLFVCPSPSGGRWKMHELGRAFKAELARLGMREELQLRDLRRSKVVRMGEAELTVPQICAITGHSLESATSILETYLPRNTAMAVAGVAKLENARRTKVGSPANTKLE